MLHLLADLQEEYRMALILITHDLGVVARIADRVLVMYAGQVVETGTAEQRLCRSDAPLHARVSSTASPIPGKTRRGAKLGSIPGMVPSLVGALGGCQFRGRCAHALPACAAAPVPLRDLGPGRASRCLLDGLPDAPSRDPSFAGAAR